MNDETKNYYPTVQKLCNSSDVYKIITEEQFETILLEGGKSILPTIFEIRNPETSQRRRDKLKLQLPGIAFQARFKPGKRTRNRYNIETLTEELLIEEDGILFDEKGDIIKFASPEEARTKRNEVISEHWKYIKYAYDSANCRNHYVIRVKGVTVQNFKAACKYAAKLLGIVIDPKGIHPSRLAAISFDPNAYINKSDVDFIDVSIVQEKEKKMVEVNAPDVKTDLRANGKHRFFTQSVADIHLSKFISQNLENIIYYPEGYVVSIHKLPMIKLFGRRTFIAGGERNETLFRDFSLYVSLNGCNQTNEQLWDGFVKYSNKWCRPQLEESELEEIFKKVLDRSSTGNLSVGAFEQNGAWFSWSKLGGKEKKGLASSAKRHRNILVFLSNLVKLDLTKEERQKISVNELATKLDMPRQTIYNYQLFIQGVIPKGAKSKNDICSVLKKGSFVQNEISSFTIYNKILYYIVEMGLYDFGFLHPPSTVGGVIQRLIEIGAKVTKKLVAENLGCSESKVKRSNEWKEYQRKLNDGILPNRSSVVPNSISEIPCIMTGTVNDLINNSSIHKGVFDFRSTTWFRYLSQENQIRYEREILNGRSVADVFVEAHDPLPLFDIPLITMVIESEIESSEL